MAKLNLIPRLQKVEQRFRNLFIPHALILMYHRVIELPNDPNLVAVSTKHFSEQMQVIKRRSTPIRLQELVEALQAGCVPNRAIVVTFDDGYADNLYNAKPILEQYEVPATVYVTAGQLESRREFWWDELDRLLLQPGELPDRLRLFIRGSALEWDLGWSATYTEQDFRRNRGWHIECKKDPGPRQRLFRFLFDKLQTLPVLERQKILDDLAVWAEAGTTGRATHRTLTHDEVILLDHGDLIEVGAHTMTHPSLAALSLPAQRNEIQDSKACLEAILRHPVTSFAFPNGSSNQQTIQTLGELGFLCACSSNPDGIRKNADLFKLSRVVVRDWDGETFDRWLSWWMGE